MTAKIVAALPQAESTRLVPFTKSRVVPGIVPKTYFLIVEGTQPCVNMTVRLSPRIYIRRPEYWGIEVIGSLPGGICLPVIAKYTVALPLDGVTGTKGVEVIGANKKKKHRVPPA